MRFTGTGVTANARTEGSCQPLGELALAITLARVRRPGKRQHLKSGDQQKFGPL